MPEWVTAALALIAGVLVLWLVLVGLLWWQVRRSGERTDWRALLRLVPDVIRLLGRLVRDPEVPRGVRWVLLALLGYLLVPVDLVPDFLPVVGWADDAVVVALALCFAVRRAGRDALESRWPGSPEGLRALLSLVGLGGPEPEHRDGGARN